MFGEMVTRLRREQTGTDRYGDPVYTDVEAPLPEGAAFAPKGSVVSLQVGREMVTTADTLYFTTRPDLTDADRVRVRGLVRTIQGRPQDWRSPWGTDVGGLVVELEDVTG